MGSLEIDPVGLAEIATRLGVQRSTVDAWRVRKLLPPPRWTVGGRPAWDWAAIERWAVETGRLRGAGEDQEMYQAWHAADRVSDEPSGLTFDEWLYNRRADDR